LPSDSAVTADLDEDVPPRVWSTTVGALRLRVSRSFTMWNPAADRSNPETSPGFIPRTGSVNTVGSRAGTRQPRLPP
jgi:hypothetical protein